MRQSSQLCATLGGRKSDLRSRSWNAAKEVRSTGGISPIIWSPNWCGVRSPRSSTGTRRPARTSTTAMKFADHEIEEHAEVEELLKQFEDVDAADPRFDELLGQMTENVRHHVEDEENDLPPKLRSACSEESCENSAEGLAGQEDRADAPHPAAPTTPPANLIPAPGAGFLGNIRDALSGRTT